MLSQPESQISISKYIPDYHLISRTKGDSSPSYYPNGTHIHQADGSPMGSPTKTVDQDRGSSPHLPQPPSANYTFSPRNSTSSLDAPASPVEIYQAEQNVQSYPPPTHHQYSSASGAPEQPSYDINNPAPTTTDSGPIHSYLSESPSPVDPHRSVSALPHPITVSQDPFLHSDPHPYPAGDRLPSHPDPGPERSSREYQLDKYPNPNLQNSLLDQRRMSEPAALSGPALYASSISDPSAGSRYPHFGFAYNPPLASRSATSLYVSPLHRGASTGSLRDMRHSHLQYPQQQEWKLDEARHRETQQQDFYDHGIDEPISPMQPNFTGGLLGSPTSGLPYSPTNDNFYGPSPPGTGTSTSSSIAPLSAGIPCSPSRSISQHLQRSLSTSHLSSDAIDRKTYSFVALPGNAVKKRPRRRYDEIERLYLCSWPDCNKSYGTLNHLNAHVTMQKHGPKRSPNEFKELRKQWRKAKKEQEVAAMGMRRESFSDNYDDHSGFNHRYLGSHSLHHRQHSHQPGMALTGSVAVGTVDRYAVAIDGIRYPPQDREDDFELYDDPSLTARQRYSGLHPPSWHGSTFPTRPNIQAYTPSPLTKHTHHSHLPQLAINTHMTRPSPTPVHGNRLPQNSTLLTPLHGHGDPSLIAPLDNTRSVGYTEGYDVYETDTSRPGTGHASDEFDHSQ